MNYAVADDGFEVKSIEYENYMVHGDVITPDGVYFVRVTMFLEDNYYIVLTAPVQDGQFHVYVASACEHITVCIVDRIDAFVPGTYHVYAVMGKDM